MATTLVGPNCPGVISPGEANVGIIPGEICAPGRVGLVSRSGTLVYQIVHELTQLGLGQSTCIGMGGDPVHGIGFIESLAAFQDDADTDLVVMVGEIGGDDEERAAAYIADHVTKPVVGYIAGFEAPPGKRMGHAGAIVTGSMGTAAAKAEALEAAGVRVGRTPTRGRRAGAGGRGVNPAAPPAPRRRTPTEGGPGPGLRGRPRSGAGSLAFVVTAFAAQIVPIAIDVFGGGLALSTALKLGWFYELAFHRVAIDVTGAGGATGRISRRVPVGDGVRDLGAVPSGPDGGSPCRARRVGARVLAGAMVGPVYALPIAVITSFVRLRLAHRRLVRSRDRAGSTASSGRRSSSRRSSGSAPGAPAGALELLAARTRGYVRGSSGGWRALLGALGLAAIGVLVLAAVRPQGTADYARAVSSNGPRVAALLLGHHALLLPNQSFFVLGAVDGRVHVELEGTDGDDPAALSGPAAGRWSRRAPRRHRARRRWLRSDADRHDPGSADARRLLGVRPRPRDRHARRRRCAGAGAERSGGVSAACGARARAWCSPCWSASGPGWRAPSCVLAPRDGSDARRSRSDRGRCRRRCSRWRGAW